MIAMNCVRTVASAATCSRIPNTNHKHISQSERCDTTGTTNDTDGNDDDDLNRYAPEHTDKWLVMDSYCDDTVSDVKESRNGDQETKTGHGYLDDYNDHQDNNSKTDGTEWDTSSTGSWTTAVDDCNSGKIDIHPSKQDQSDWNKELQDTLLRAQENSSESMIARRVAKLGILLSLDVERFYARLEREAWEKIAHKKAESLKAERRRRVVLIDTREDLRTVLDRLESLDHSQAQVVIDCEGLDYKTTGTIDIMELFVRPDDVLFLLDVIALKQATWTITASNSKFCLASFLSSQAHKKIMWDLRMDAHVMNKLYGVKLAGIIDSSIWAVAYRGQQNREFHDFRISIEAACQQFLRQKIHPAEMQSLQDAKEARSLLPPRPWACRPLPLTLIDYAADVKYMGMIYDVLEKRLRNDPTLIREIEWTTEQELAIASDHFWSPSVGRGANSPFSYRYLETAWEALKLNRQDSFLEATMCRRLRRCFLRVMY